ncbi:glutaminyl-peptide cyclotransferase isoform X2 [Leptinotarsa decemlineata]|uniref:glutaminyl-peptide cyclotransferase isoform X2 n=1 Tax=Leptinotarsa decemlineata TaxID=7539 RepID=UPI000C251B23|nr:glutaminyl-peptide cyclotransferase [Leptinotarsa decemlineata]
MSYGVKSIILATLIQGQGSQLKTNQINHKPQTLSNAEIRFLAGLTNSEYTNEVLDNILIPRVVGTPNHKKVFEYIKKELQKLNWNVHIDEFESNTPHGLLTFRNIIASLNPQADRYLVLACHYDSKYFKDEVFVGATDSAVPCAMILNLAKVMKQELHSLKNNIDLNLKLIFFDGEEAFVSWGPNDSIYGARHLANLYHNNHQKTLSSEEVVSDLQRMDMLVLLDLIGHKDTKFYSSFENTQNWYLRLTAVEDKLKSLNLIKNNKNQRYFIKRTFHGFVEDDHIPFLEKNVPVLHLISHPFPREWHTAGDNRDIIDMDTVENINRILRVFVAEYLNMSVNPNS